MQTPWGEAPRDYENPEWDVKEKIHNWRNYISEDLQKIWFSFTSEQKVKIAANADIMADREDWD